METINLYDPERGRMAIKYFVAVSRCWEKKVKVIGITHKH
jgi:hypothetical protein